jgi:multidrug efflux pump subunit AcrA (membrane-fusion protein)
VVYYTTKFTLEDADDRLKTGMSADANVETAKSENALLISRRAVKEDDNGIYVEIYDGINPPVRRDIETGLENDEGDVEIVKGLSEGERVVVGSGSN